MADAAVPTPQYAAPATAASGKKEQYIQQTPVWVVVLRALQIFFSFVILIMAGVVIHGHAMAANGFAVVCVRIAHPRKGLPCVAVTDGPSHGFAPFLDLALTARSASSPGSLSSMGLSRRR
jgi:hypothetical protein